MSVEPKALSVMDANVSAVTSVPKPDEVKFGDIRFKKSGVDWVVENYSPQPIRHFIAAVDINGGRTIREIHLDSPIPAYSQATIRFTTETIDDLRFEHQLGMFNPIIIFKRADAPDCSAVPDSVCYGDTDERGRSIFETILTNMHHGFNRKIFDTTMQAYFSKDGECERWSECQGYEDTGINYGKRNLYLMGMSDHRLSMREKKNVYLASGMAWGQKPDLKNIRSTKSGWASIWHNNIGPTKTTKQLFSNGNYNIVFHEIAHAYGFSHSSGMTYGFTAGWAYSTKYGDTWAGYSIMDKYFSLDERERVSEVKIPSVVVDKKSQRELEVRFELFYPSYSLGFTDLAYEVVSDSRTSFRVISNTQSNVFTLLFAEKPDAPVYVRFVDNNGDYMSTSKITARDLYPTQEYMINDAKLTVLSSKMTKPTDNVESASYLCNKPFEEIASTSWHQALWDRLSTDGNLNLLLEKNFIAFDKNENKTWLVSYEDSSLVLDNVTKTTNIGNVGVLCLENLN